MSYLIIASITIVGIILFRKYCEKGEIAMLEEKSKDCVCLDEFLDGFCFHKGIDKIQGLTAFKKLKEKYPAILIDINNKKEPYVFTHKTIVIIHLRLAMFAIDKGVPIEPDFKRVG